MNAVVRRDRPTRRIGSTWPRRLATRAAVAGLATAGVALASPVTVTAGNPSAGPSDRLVEVERQGTELDREADELASEAQATETRVERLGEKLDVVARRLADARDREEQAERDADDARARAAQVDQELGAAQEELREVEVLVVELARRTYMNGASAVDPMLAAIESSSGDAVGGLTEELHYLGRILGVHTASLEGLVSLRIRLGALRELASVERAAAIEALGAAKEASEVVATAHAAMLALTDQASEELTEWTQRLDEVNRQREALAVTKEKLRAAAERTGRDGVGSPAPPSAMDASGASHGRLSTVRGITVDASIASSLEQLLAAAAADGFVLGGSGYRSPEVTARLRLSNGCPDVYDAPASSCRIPTARPGTSEHEAGLAIDLTWRGRTLCYPRASSRCSGNAAFDWLQANAARFGFYNLPSEAWHWSTTGR